MYIVDSHFMNSMHINQTNNTTVNMESIVNTVGHTAYIQMTLNLTQVSESYREIIRLYRASINV